jgi:hypothetical protein
MCYEVEVSAAGRSLAQSSPIECGVCVRLCVSVCVCVKECDPITGLDRPIGLQEVEALRFQNSRHMKVVRL